VLGNDDPDMHPSINNPAIVLKEQGEYAEVEAETLQGCRGCRSS
jgi:hypothetical protein